MLQKIQKYLRRIHNLFITNKLSLKLEALSNCDNFTVIRIFYNNDVLDGHKVSFDNSAILLKESNPFKLQLKKSLLISRDKPILNKNIYSFPLELFD